MTITKRLIAAILCLITLFSVVACAADDEASSSDSESSSGSGMIQRLPSEVPNNYVSIAEHEIANYRIVYENSLSPAVIKKINQNLDTVKTKTGITMEVYTDQKGMQIFTKNFADEGRVCKDGAVYNMHGGICFETQAFPNSTRFSHFPGGFLKKGETMTFPLQCQGLPVSV